MHGYGKFFVYLVYLRQVTDVYSVGFNVVVIKGNRSGSWFYQPPQNSFQQGCFSSAIRTYNTQKIILKNAEIDIFQNIGLSS